MRFGSSLKCGACGKTIYPNDNKLSMGDKVYHKQCAKCEVCGGQLTISNFATSGNRLLCKVHFMKEFSESGGVYGGDERFSKGQSRSNSTASATSGERTGPNSPAVTATKICPPSPPKEASKAKIPEQEDGSSSGRKSVADMVKATSKAPPPPPEAAKQAQAAQNVVSSSNRKSVAEMVEATKSVSVSSTTADVPKAPAKLKFRFGGGSSKKCPICKKTIYPNDSQLSIGSSVYHRACAKCSTCGGQLTISNFATSGDRLLCKTHFMEEFATSGGHYGGDDKFEKASSRSNSTVSSVSTPKVTDELPKKESQGAKPSSPSTDAPKIKDDDKLPENLSTAPTIVQANNATEKRVTAEVSHSEAAPVDEVPKRISVAERIKQDREKRAASLSASGANVSSDDKQNKRSSSAPRRSRFGSANSIKCGACGKTIYPNDNKLSMGDKVYHKQCAKCEVCGGQLTISNFATSGNRLLCKVHFMKEFSESGGVYGGDERFSKGQSRSSSTSSN
eukprot:g2933.t1